VLTIETRLPVGSAPLAAETCRNDDSRAERGAVAIEFALLAPVLLLLLLGAVQFGLILRNYVMLTNAVNVGAMQFAISRSATTPASTAWTALTNAAPTLTPTTNIEMTLSVGSPLTACVTNANSLSAAEAADSTCATALAGAAPSGGTLQPAAVTVTYPCGSQLTWYSFWSSTCKLTSTMTEGVQ
jgi:Flp pilus assembly protein TadG